MISKENERLLLALERIESSVAKIYKVLAACHDFTDSARECWASVVDAELKHARLFRELRERANQDGSIQVEVDFPLDQLKNVIHKLKGVWDKISTGRGFSEAEAYSLGAFIEEMLSEFGFSKRIRTNDPRVLKRIKEIENDTRQHYIVLHNRSLSGTKPLKPDLPITE